jgi:hypothetical protein
MLAFVVVALIRFGRRAREGTGLARTRKEEHSRVAITLVVFALIFGTIWLFYLRGGLEDAKAAWEFCGPIMGAVVGWWFPSK